MDMHSTMTTTGFLDSRKNKDFNATGTLWPKWTQQVKKGTQNRQEKDGHRHKISLMKGQRILGRCLVI